jgi:hypothetical protein
LVAVTLTICNIISIHDNESLLLLLLPASWWPGSHFSNTLHADHFCSLVSHAFLSWCYLKHKLLV